MVKRFLLNIIFTVVPFVLGHSGNSFAQCEKHNTAFTAGEQLTYGVYYNWGFINIKLAKVVLWTEQAHYQGKNVLALKNTTKTVEKYKWIIDADDYYVSYVAPYTLKSYKHIQKTVVDDYFTNNEYVFDYENGKIYATVENSKTARFTDTLEMHSCISDLLTAVYYLRILDFQNMKTGQKVIIPVVLDTTIHEVYYKYAGDEILKFNDKEEKCKVIIPSIVETSTFKGGETMKVWIKPDKNRLPLQMTSDLRIGKILAVLESYEGLRYKAVN